MFQRSEMEFLDIVLTKESSLMLHAIHSLFYYRILQTTILSHDFKNSHKKSMKQENSTIFMNIGNFVDQKNEGRKPDNNSYLGRPETSTKNDVQEFHRQTLM